MATAANGSSPTMMSPRLKLVVARMPLDLPLPGTSTTSTPASGSGDGTQAWCNMLTVCLLGTDAALHCTVAVTYGPFGDRPLVSARSMQQMHVLYWAAICAGPLRIKAKLRCKRGPPLLLGKRKCTSSVKRRGLASSRVPAVPACAVAALLDCKLQIATEWAGACFMRSIPACYMHTFDLVFECRTIELLCTPHMRGHRTKSRSSTLVHAI